MKTVDFSETIAACDLQVGSCRQLIELMKVFEDSMSMTLDHGQEIAMTLNTQIPSIKTWLSQKQLGHF